MFYFHLFHKHENLSHKQNVLSFIPSRIGYQIKYGVRFLSFSKGIRRHISL